MTIAFWILGWVMWNGIAFFILRWLNCKFEKNCNMMASGWQLMKAMLCLIAMAAVGLSALLAASSLIASNDEI